MSRSEGSRLVDRSDLDRITAALTAACELLASLPQGETRFKAGDDPVTEADTRLDQLLRSLLPRPGEGWLSEETEDDLARLACDRVWVVDPLDGTREFVAGIPEWCVSVALVHHGEPVAGGLVNPATGELIVGGRGHGVTLNGRPAGVTGRTGLAGATVLASRSEIRRGEWDRWGQGRFEVAPTGSVAYKLGRVAAGLADATWTLSPKHEWDVAAGVALVLAGGGSVRAAGDEELRFNRRVPRLSRLIATTPALLHEIEQLLARELFDYP